MAGIKANNAKFDELHNHQRSKNIFLSDYCYIHQLNKDKDDERKQNNMKFIILVGKLLMHFAMNTLRLFISNDNSINKLFINAKRIIAAEVVIFKSKSDSNKAKAKAVKIQITS